jgi:hypothetical protein
MEMGIIVNMTTIFEAADRGYKFDVITISDENDYRRVIPYISDILEYNGILFMVTSDINYLPKLSTFITNMTDLEFQGVRIIKPYYLAVYSKQSVDLDFKMDWESFLRDVTDVFINFDIFKTDNKLEIINKREIIDEDY